MGLSQDELGAAAGVHKETISRIERGHYEPAVSTLIAIAKALDVSVSELFGELEPRDRPAQKVSPMAKRLRAVVDELPADAQRALLEVAELLKRP